MGISFVPSPIVTGTGPGPLVSPAFAVPDKALVVCLVGAGWGTPPGVTMAVTDSSGGTWTQGPTATGAVAGAGGAAGIWYCYFAQSPGTITITVTYTGFAGGGGGTFNDIWAMLGADPSQTGNGRATSTPSGGTDGTLQVTTTRPDSFVLGVGNDATNQQTLAPNSNSQIDFQYNDATDGISTVGWVSKYFTGTPGTAFYGGTWGASAASSNAAMEILPALNTSLLIPADPPRGAWSFVLGPASGGHTVALTGAKNRKFTARLTAPSEASFDIDGRHPQAAYINELATDLHIIYTPGVGPASIIYRGRIGNTTDNLTASEHTVNVTSMDYREVLRRRLLYNSSTLTFANQDQGDIALNLIGQTQALPGGNLSISRGVGYPTGTVRTLSYLAGDSIGDSIQAMSVLYQGFDWDITPRSPSALALDIWTSIRGTYRSVVCEYGGLVETVRREIRSSDYANAVRVTGDQRATTPPTPQERTSVDIATVAQGRWDKTVTAPGALDLAALQSRADAALANTAALYPAYTLTLRRNGWRGPGHIWLGDPVQLVIKSGRLAVVDKSLRVQELAIDIADDGVEVVTLTVGRPPLNYDRWPSLTDQRLRDLERR